MKFRSALMISPFIAVLFVLNGCADEKPARAEGNAYFVKGDPMVFVQNTVRNTDGTIRQATADSDATFTLSIVSFEQIGRKQSFQQIQAQQDPSNREASSLARMAGPDQDEMRSEVSARGSSRPAGEGYKFVRRGDGTVSLTTPQSPPADFNFTIANGVLNLRSITFKGNTHWAGKDFTLLHNSSTPSGDGHSILVLERQGRFNSLVIYNVRTEPKVAAVVQRASREFEFSTSRYGEKIGWPSDSPVEVQVCEPALPVFREMVDRSLRDWNEILRGRLILQRGKMTKCPPFSDVNTHTVNFIPDWIEGFGPNLMVNGMTLRESSVKAGKIYGMDMFILIGEWDEYLKRHSPGRKADEDYFRYGYHDRGKSVRVSMQRTLTHEFGHFIGLDHKFDKTPSIMSYNDEDTQLTDYDRRAAQALYDINPRLSQSAPPPRSESQWRFRQN